MVLIHCNTHRKCLKYEPVQNYIDLVFCAVNPEILAIIFIFANSLKRHICDVKSSQLGHDIPISVNNRVILPFSKGFIFMKLHICEVSRNKTLARIIKFTVYFPCLRF